MTFFDKLFTSKNKFFSCDNNATLSCSRSRNDCHNLDLSPENVRVVLFRECERRGRKLLFDSEAVEKIGPDCSGRLPSSSDVVETSPSHAYKYKKPNKDVASLGEMIFGSVAIASKGGSISKIHNMAAPHRLMFTTVMPTHLKCHPRSNRSHTNKRQCSSDSMLQPSKQSSCDQRPTSSAYSSQDSLVQLGSNNPVGGCISTLHRSAACASLRALGTASNSSSCCPAEDTVPGLHRTTACSSLKALGTVSNSSDSKTSCCPPGGCTSGEKDQTLHRTTACSSLKALGTASSSSDSKIGCCPAAGCASEVSALRWTTACASLNSCCPARGCSSAVSTLHRSAACSSLRALGTPSNSSDSKISSGVASATASACCDDSAHSAPSSRRPSGAKTCSFTSGRSLFSSFGSYCDSKSSNVSLNCSGESLNNLRRRWQQSLAVSLDGSTCDEGGRETPVRVRTKLGLALILTLSGPNETELERFLLGNSLTMESILQQLKGEVETAYSRHEKFVQLSYGATEEATAAIVELSRMRKCSQPLWLRPAPPPRKCKSGNVVPMPSGRLQFVESFCSVLKAFDTKNTNFFVSTLLTALLTHNLSWVTNIASKMPSSYSSYSDREGGDVGLNPLWAQHCEMFGAVTLPLRVAKVVLADDSSRQFLTELLEILSYFIRGTTVLEQTFEGNFDQVTNPKIVQTPIVPKLAEVVKEENAITWFVEENFDSGVDCEMRDPFFASLDMGEIVTEGLSIETKTEDTKKLSQHETEVQCSFLEIRERTVKLRSEVLVTSASERTRPVVDHLTPRDKPGKFVDNYCVTGDRPGKFVDNYFATEGARQCCNSLKSSCSSAAIKTEPRQSLYPDLSLLAEMENVRLEDLTSARDKTVFVEEVLKMAERGPKMSEMVKCAPKVSESVELRTKVNEMVDLLPKVSQSMDLLPEVNESVELMPKVRDVVDPVPRVSNFVELLPRVSEGLADETREGNTKSPTPDEGYETLHGDLGREMAKNVVFELGGDNAESTLNRSFVTKATSLRADAVPRRRKCPTRSQTVNIPVFEGLKLLKSRSRTLEDVGRECSPLTSPDSHDSSIASAPELPSTEPSDEEKLMQFFEELPMPCCPMPVSTRALPKCPVVGGIYPSLLPQFSLQAITKSAADLEDALRSDLSRMSAGSQTIPDPGEAVYILADLKSWSVNVHSTALTTLGAPRAVPTTASQLVADMLESFSNMRRAGLPSNMCLEHVERKLEEMYRKSTVVAELLMTTEFCTVDHLTSRLHIAVNDVPLLLAIASTHTPEITEKYGVSFS